MRRFLMLLVLVAPLAAGELENSVERFRSDDAAEREAGSRSVHRIVRAHLEPLLAAMRDPDPEVARRARAALLSLLPRPPAQPKPAASPGGVGVANGVVVLGGGGRGQRIRFNIVNGRLNVVNENAGPALKKFGVSGHAVPDGLARRQLRLPAGRGLAITDVAVRSPARKLGLRKHDIVLRVDGKPVLRLDQLKKELGAEKTWAKRKLLVIRAGKVLDLPESR